MIQLEGWWCTNASSPDAPACRTFNGEEKEKRAACRACGGPRSAPEGISRDDLFRICALMVRERNEAVESVTRMQEKLARYIECAQAAKAFVDTSGSFAFGVLVAAVGQLEEDPATSAAMQRRYEPPTVPATVTVTGADGRVVETREAFTSVRPRKVPKHKGDCNIWCEPGGDCYEVTEKG